MMADAPKVTLHDVAERAKVHPSTVSRALSPVISREVSEATRMKVLEVAAELGYRPNVVARGLRQGRTGTVGVVITDFEHLFNAPVLRGIEAGLEEGGFMPLVTETHDSSARLERALDHLAGRRADAVIVTASRYGDKAVVAQAAKFLPVILTVRSLPGTRLPTIAHDDHRGGLLAARHLVSLGHRRIAQLGGARDVSSFVQRRRGFGTGLREAGLSVEGRELAARVPSVDEGYRMGTELLRSVDVPPTALFAHNDLIAAGAIDAFAETGLRCPEDISVVGYDDMVLADHLNPPLTTVRLPSFQLGRLAAQVTRSLLDRPGTPAPRISLPPELVVRSSTAPACRPEPVPG